MELRHRPTLSAPLQTQTATTQTITCTVTLSDLANERESLEAQTDGESDAPPSQTRRCMRKDSDDAGGEEDSSFPPFSSGFAASASRAAFYTQRSSSLMSNFSLRSFDDGQARDPALGAPDTTWLGDESQDGDLEVTEIFPLPQDKAVEGAEEAKPLRAHEDKEELSGPFSGGSRVHGTGSLGANSSAAAAPSRRRFPLLRENSLADGDLDIGVSGLPSFAAFPNEPPATPGPSSTAALPADAAVPPPMPPPMLHGPSGRPRRFLFRNLSSLGPDNQDDLGIDDPPTLIEAPLATSSRPFRDPALELSNLKRPRSPFTGAGPVDTAMPPSPMNIKRLRSDPGAQVLDDAAGPVSHLDLQRRVSEPYAMASARAASFVASDIIETPGHPEMGCIVGPDGQVYRLYPTSLRVDPSLARPRSAAMPSMHAMSAREEQRQLQEAATSSFDATLREALVAQHAKTYGSRPMEEKIKYLYGDLKGRLLTDFDQPASGRNNKQKNYDLLALHKKLRDDGDAQGLRRFEEKMNVLLQERYRRHAMRQESQKKAALHRTKGENGRFARTARKSGDI